VIWATKYFAASFAIVSIHLSQDVLDEIESNGLLIPNNPNIPLTTADPQFAVVLRIVAVLELSVSLALVFCGKEKKDKFKERRDIIIIEVIVFFADIFLYIIQLYIVF